MIVDVGTPGALEIPPGSVVVVGSGAAGIALALRLATNGRPVVLHESGDDNTGAARTPTALALRLADHLATRRRAPLG